MTNRTEPLICKHLVMSSTGGGGGGDTYNYYYPLKTIKIISETYKIKQDTSILKVRLKLD